MTEKRHSVLFNKNASPFYPASFPPPSGPGSNTLQNFNPTFSNGAPPLEVELSNLPRNTSPEELEDWLSSQLPGWGFSVFQVLENHALVLFASPSAAKSASSTLNGRKWLGSEIVASVAVRPDGQRDMGVSGISVHTSGTPLPPSGTPVLPSGNNPPSSFYYMPPYGYPVNVDYAYYNPVPFLPYFYGVSPINTRSPSRRSSRLVSRQNSVNGSYKPTPPFLLNMVKLPETADTTPDSEDLGLITIEDDEGNIIRANPKRLFVGNIPFNSTWPALKNFLILKAEEIEPGNDIDILRVEIPMQQPRDTGNDISKLNLYQFLTLLSQQLQDKSASPTPELPRANSVPGTGPTRGLSRGFAIVTTANKKSLDKIIEYFDNVDFEGRTLTVRYDRFPDFNNYVLQQLYPSNKNGGGKPAILSNLAFERNSFQQKFYYGNQNQNQNHSHNQPNFRQNIHMDELSEPLKEIEALLEIPNHVLPTDEEKARELVNSFSARDLST